MRLFLLPLLLVTLAATGCYPVRNPVPAGPGGDTALSNTLPDPVRDPADDPDTASPVESQDAPGDAGTFSPGALRPAAPRPESAGPARVGPSAEELSARRAERDGPRNRAVLDNWQSKQRAELDARKARQENGRLGDRLR